MTLASPFANLYEAAEHVPALAIERSNALCISASQGIRASRAAKGPSPGESFGCSSRSPSNPHHGRHEFNASNAPKTSLLGPILLSAQAIEADLFRASLGVTHWGLSTGAGKNSACSGNVL